MSPKQQRYSRRHAVKIRLLAKRWRAANPQKRRAHAIVKRAIEAGILRRPNSCENCGKPCRPHGHHEDYSKPLIVNWLCVACHSAKHGVCVNCKRTYYHGERHPRAKLTQQQVDGLRWALAKNLKSRRGLAREYGVDESLIRQIEKGKIWKETT